MICCRGRTNCLTFAKKKIWSLLEPGLAPVLFLLDGCGWSVTKEISKAPRPDFVSSLGALLYFQIDAVQILELKYSTSSQTVVIGLLCREIGSIPWFWIWLARVFALWMLLSWWWLYPWWNGGWWLKIEAASQFLPDDFLNPVYSIPGGKSNLNFNICRCFSKIENKI